MSKEYEVIKMINDDNLLKVDTNGNSVSSPEGYMSGALINRLIKTQLKCNSIKFTPNLYKEIYDKINKCARKVDNNKSGKSLRYFFLKEDVFKILDNEMDIRKNVKG